MSDPNVLQLFAGILLAFYQHNSGILLAKIADAMASALAGQGGVPMMKAKKRAVLLLANAAWLKRRSVRNDAGTERGGVMADELPDSANGKGRKRVAAKPPTRPAVTKVKSTIHLSVEASQRLDIHATMMGFDRSALVEKLIQDHLRRYVVSDRGRTEDAASGEAAV